MSSVDLASLFKSFNEAQQRRPAIYKRMQQAFDERYEGCSHYYADASKEITMEHLEASKIIVSTAAAFEAIPAAAQVAALIRSLQLLEKEKLHLTAALYIMEQKHEDNQEEFAGFEEAEYDKQLEAKKKQILKIVSQINDILDEIKEEELSLILEQD